MIVLVPAYEPDRRLLELLADLPHHQVVVVDDGSGAAYAPVFDAAAAVGADVVRLEANRGKGAALKAGFEHIGHRWPGHDVVCVDSDGQHRPADVQRVADRLADTGGIVLGTRRFTGPAPARSRIGNAITRLAFLAATGRTVTDTQTGLRGFPAHLLPWLSAVPGQRYEYELNQLLHAVRDGHRVDQVEIETVYLDGNASSHFRPLVDSARVYAQLLAFSASSLVGFALDTVLLLALVWLTGNLVLSAVTARLVSASVNFEVNRRWVFARHGRPPAGWRAAARYAVLAAAVLVLNVVLLDALVTVMGSVLPAKVVTEAAFFLVSFVVQRQLVFARPAAVEVAPRSPVEQPAAACQAIRRSASS